MDTIVVVAAVASPLVLSLRAAGWRVRVVPPTILDEIGTHVPDVVILDLASGADLAAAVENARAAPGLESPPLFAIIAADQLREVAALRLLTDFVLRSAHVDELAARLRRALRRQNIGAPVDELRAGPLRIELKRFQASLDGAPLDLTYQEFQLLRFLVSHPDHAFSREQILARVWGWDYFGGSRTVDIHVRRVRAKLGHPLSGCLETVRHVGYRWSSDLDRALADNGGSSA